MPTINISLPEDLKKYVEETVKNEGYGNTSEFFRELLRARRKIHVSEKVELMLLEGFAGPTKEASERYWNEMRVRLFGPNHQELEGED